MAAYGSELSRLVDELNRSTTATELAKMRRSTDCWRLPSNAAPLMLFWWLDRPSRCASKAP